MFKSIDALNASCNAVTRLVDMGSDYSSGSLNIYGWDASTVLAILPLPLPAFQDATDGTAVSNLISDSTTILDGTASFFGVLNRDASTVWTGTVSDFAGSGDLKINSIYFAQDSSITITNMVYIVPPEFTYFGNPGATGIQGSQGVTGPSGGGSGTGIGTQGATGIQGPTGAYGGPQGETGIQGLGLTGVDGATGLQGFTGIGIQGDTGIQGQTGPQGNQGSTGLGATGLQGAQGFQGLTGVQGDQGATGLIGPAGLTGAPGVQGITGNQGIVGYQGITGNQGAPGLGATGIQGLTGVQGQTGALGNTGLAGSGGTGLQGPTGIAGSQGSTGLRGLTGLAGTGGTGIQGPTGIQGQTGSQGVTGLRGFTGLGATGLQGVTGVGSGGGLSGPLYSEIFSYQALSGTQESWIKSSGTLITGLSWSRTGTTCTITHNGHGLSDGDYVICRNLNQDYVYSAVSGSTLNTFDITVAGSGTFSGSAGAYAGAFGISSVAATGCTINPPNASSIVGDIQIISMNFTSGTRSSGGTVTITIPTTIKNGGTSNNTINSNMFMGYLVSDPSTGGNVAGASYTLTASTVQVTGMVGTSSRTIRLSF